MWRKIIKWLVKLLIYCKKKLLGWYFRSRFRESMFLSWVNFFFIIHCGRKGVDLLRYFIYLLWEFIKKAKKKRDEWNKRPGWWEHSKGREKAFFWTFGTILIIVCSVGTYFIHRRRKLFFVLWTKRLEIHYGTYGWMREWTFDFFYYGWVYNGHGVFYWTLGPIVFWAGFKFRWSYSILDWTFFNKPLGALKLGFKFSFFFNTPWFRWRWF